MMRRHATVAAWALLATYVACVAATVALIALQSVPADGLGALGFAGYAAVGTLIALRRPGNAVGWILLGVAVSFAVGTSGAAYAVDPANPGRVPIAWMTSTTQFVWFSLAAVFLPLVFPHGRLVSRRWRPVVWAVAGGMVLGIGGGALVPGPLEINDVSIENPAGVDSGIPERVSRLGTLLEAICCVLAAASLVSRFRRSRGAERQQIKWFSLVGLLTAACALVAIGGALAGEGTPGWVQAGTTAGWFGVLLLIGVGLPAATGIAVLRHRLYDVDVVIRRTLVYAALSATLAVAYFASVVVAGLAVGSSDIAIAASTLAVAALFRPARARIQRAVDRRFFRRRYDARQTIEAFASRLRDELDPDAVAADVRGLVEQTLHPVHVSFWVRERR